MKKTGLLATLLVSAMLLSSRAKAQSTTDYFPGKWKVTIYGTPNGDAFMYFLLQRKDGKLKWIHQLPRWQNEEDKEDRIFWAGPVLVSNRLITVSSDGYAEAISPYTGQLIGRVAIPSGAYIAPVVANQTLYILTNDAQLVALR